MDHTYLNPEAFNRGRRKSMSETALNTYTERLNALIDKFQEIAPNDLPTLLKNAIRNKGNKSENLTQDDESSIAKNIMNHIKNKPYASPQDKAANLYSVLKSMGLSGSGGAAGVTFRSLEKEALASNDVNMMIRMSNNQLRSRPMRACHS